MGAACAARMVDMVDVLLLVDRDEASVVDAAKKLSDGSHRADVEPVRLDITDASGLDAAGRARVRAGHAARRRPRRRRLTDDGGLARGPEHRPRGHGAAA